LAKADETNAAEVAEKQDEEEFRYLSGMADNLTAIICYCFERKSTKIICLNGKRLGVPLLFNNVYKEFRMSRETFYKLLCM